MTSEERAGLLHDDDDIPVLQRAETFEIPPRPASVLAGRVRALLEARGYNAVTGKVVLEHEIDVWGEDEDGRVAVAGCREPGESGLATPVHIRDFFGKVYDIRHHYCNTIDLAIYVSPGGFTEQARSLCDRLGILALDAPTLEMLERSQEELRPRYVPPEDRAILTLLRERDRLEEEIRRRKLVRSLGQEIEEYRQQLETETIPGFLVPAETRPTFWYSRRDEVPFPALWGEFVDFVCPSFPRLPLVAYTRRRLLGVQERFFFSEALKLDGGIVHADPRARRAPLQAGTPETTPRLGEIVGRPVVTLDQTLLGSVADLQIAFEDGWRVRRVLVTADDALKESLKEPEFTLPGERTTLRRSADGWVVVALVRLAADFAIKPR